LNHVARTPCFLKVVLHGPTCNANFSRNAIAPFLSRFFFDLLHGDNFSRNTHFHAQSSRYQHTHNVCFSFVLASINSVSTLFYRLCFCNSGHFFSFNLPHEHFCTAAAILLHGKSAFDMLHAPI